MSYEDVRQAIVDGCTRLEAQDLVAGASGNVSVRLPPADGRELLAVTPSQIPYRVLQPEQIMIIDLEGNVVEGEHRPSSETKSHLAAYRARADVGSVIHTHSVHASALAVAGEDLPALLDEQVVALGGGVKVAEFGMSASEDLGQKAVAALDKRQAVFLRSHGVLGVGRDLDEALSVVSMVERCARIYLLARQLGNVETLPQNIVDVEIKFFRAQHGLPTDD